MTKKAFAAAVGLSAGRISQMIEVGLPVRADGKIDEAEGRRWIENALDMDRREAARPGSTAGLARGSITNLRAAKLQREALLLDVDLRRKQGDLIDRKEAEAAIFTRARFERDAWLGWVSGAAVVIAAEAGGDGERVFRVLERLVREQLSSLAEDRTPSSTAEVS